MAPHNNAENIPLVACIDSYIYDDTFTSLGLRYIVQNLRSNGVRFLDIHQTYSNTYIGGKFYIKLIRNTQ